MTAKIDQNFFSKRKSAVLRVKIDPFDPNRDLMGNPPWGGGVGPDPPSDPPFWPGGQVFARGGLLSPALNFPMSFSPFLPETCYPLPRVLFASGGGPPKMAVSDHFLALRRVPKSVVWRPKMTTFRSFFFATS